MLQLNQGVVFFEHLRIATEIAIKSGVLVPAGPLPTS